MKKVFRGTILALLMVFVLALSAQGAFWVKGQGFYYSPDYGGLKEGLDKAAPGYAQVQFSFDVDYWLARGYLNWTIAGHIDDPYFPGWLTPFRSELDWDVNTNMVVFNGEVRPISWFSIDGSYGTGAVQQGICTDTDWLLDYSSSIPWMQTESPTSGNSHFYNFNVNFRLLGANSKLGSLDIFAGYESAFINMSMTDPLSYIYYEWMYLGGYDIYPGVNMTYDVTHKGFKIGVKGEIQPVSLLGLAGSISYSPSLDIQGEGFWNLRTEIDPSGWRFYDYGTGYSLEYDLSINIKPIEHISIQVGYRSRIMRVTQSQDWETCKAKQDGFFIEGRIAI